MYWSSSPPLSPPPKTIPCHQSCEKFQRRLDYYCHRTLLNLTETQDEFAFSEEGDFVVDGAEELELVHVHLVVRHGDRSPVNAYVLGSPVAYDCGLVEREDNISWSGLWDFPGRTPLRYDSLNTMFSHLPLHPGFTRKPCGMGKLTREGFLQLHMLGLQMQSTYGNLIEGNLTESALARSLYVQSTDSSRTMRSAAAFLLGFLPDRRELRNRVSIHVSPTKGLQAPPPGIQATFKPCRYYKSFRNAQRAKAGYFRTEKEKYHPLLEELSRMFDLEVDNQPIMMKVFDSLVARGCHANRDDIVPCCRGHCVDYELATKLYEFMDWSFSYAYTEAGSLVGTMPFLRQSVLALMEEVVEGKEEAKKFAFSFTHDNIMNQILLALGSRVEEHMPYASRIAFELWRSKAVDANSNRGGHFYVRVLFNGNPITDQLKAWTIHRNQHTPFTLLPFSNWKSYMTVGPYRDQKSYDNACGNR